VTEALGQFEPARGQIVASLTNVTVRRGGSALLRDINWTVRAGERWVVIGANGAGKSTLLQVMSGALRPTRGAVSLLGEALDEADLDDLLPRVGWASAALADLIPSDEAVLDVVLTASHASLRRGEERYDVADVARAHDLLAQVGCRRLVDRRFGSLSEGERKRVQLARAVMTDPELLLLDEPAAGLDLGGREELVSRLADLAADPDAPALVLVTHHVEEIPPGFSHCMLLAEGQVVAAGLLSDVLTSDNLSAAFGQSIAVDVIDGRYFARRTRTRAAHRRRL
jgi:iron complex transport system ATP-binding protein